MSKQRKTLFAIFGRVVMQNDYISFSIVDMPEHHFVLTEFLVVSLSFSVCC